MQGLSCLQVARGTIKQRYVSCLILWCNEQRKWGCNQINEKYMHSNNYILSLSSQVSCSKLLLQYSLELNMVMNQSPQTMKLAIVLYLFLEPQCYFIVVGHFLLYKVSKSNSCSLRFAQQNWNINKHQMAQSHHLALWFSYYTEFIICPTLFLNPGKNYVQRKGCYFIRTFQKSLVLIFLRFA